MGAYRVVLVPHDFSDDSSAALEMATSLAKKFGAVLHLVHVYHRPLEVFSPYGVALPESVVPEIRDGADRQLGELLEQVRAQGIDAEKHVCEGVPSLDIPAVAREIGADLIVMGTRGRTGLEHALLGSVTERTVRSAPCPVLSVKAEK